MSPSAPTLEGKKFAKQLVVHAIVEGTQAYLTVPLSLVRRLQRGYEGYELQFKHERRESAPIELRMTCQG